MIYIITHKKFKDVISEDGYQTLFVGAKQNRSAEEYAVRDDIADNISCKNPYYCELTGLYWLWKNVDSDIIGVCHYRRYFSDRKIKKKKYILTQKNVLELMNSYDAVLPRKRWFDGRSAKAFYAAKHDVKDWNRMTELIGRLYPEYVDDVRWFEKERKGYCYNMFIMKKKDMDSYCKWLFAILFELERSSDVSEYDEYNRRIYGFLAERMINIWLHHNKLKICEVPVYNPELLPMLIKQTKNFVWRKLKCKTR